MFRIRTLRFIPSALFSLTLLASVSAHAQEANPTSVPAPQGAVVTQSGDVFFLQGSCGSA